jgi:5-formyltetrahydrofolate cyclo-ligase
LSDPKAALRRRFRESRRSLSREQKDQFNKKASAHLLTFLSLFPGRNLAAYWPTAYELDLRQALEPLANKWSIFLPRVNGLEMQFHAWSPEDKLLANSLGILEPPAHSPLCPPQNLEIVLVPLIAIDREGMRLGQGGGYYDRFLPHTQGLTIGCGYSCQLSSEPLPHEPHDHQLAYFLSEKGLSPFPLDS